MNDKFKVRPVLKKDHFVKNFKRRLNLFKSKDKSKDKSTLHIKNIIITIISKIFLDVLHQIAFSVN